jgi:outer membrane protein assembly factor BamD
MIGIFYVNSQHFAGAESRIKGLLETYPEYADRERAYYYLGEAMRQKLVPPAQIEKYQKDFLARSGKDDPEKLTAEERTQLKNEIEPFKKAEGLKYRQEAQDYYRKLVESYPSGEWTGRAKDGLKTMGQESGKEELDS